MARHTRYQGAIIQNGSILLIRHKHHATDRTYWVFPGGGIEEGETEQECVAREMLEETNLVVEVKSLILDEPDHPDEGYKRRKTFICNPISGSARPGYEPELEAAAEYSIVEVGWFDLRDESDWDPRLLQDAITYPQLERIRKALSF